MGNSIGYAPGDWSKAMEPGGDFTGPNYVDLIRDIAVDKNGNYSDSSTVVYTSRNSTTDPGGESKGGIAKWTGGTSSSPATYHAERITDISGFLTIGHNIPNGIAVNPSNGNLFVCGTDTSKLWVKGFQIVGNFAIQADELPSSSSKDVKDAKGAPFVAPGDVALTATARQLMLLTKELKKFLNLPKTLLM